MQRNLELAQFTLLLGILILSVPEPITRQEVQQRIGVLFNLTGHHKVDDQQRTFSVGNLPPEVRVVALVWPNSFFVAMYTFVLSKIHG